MPHPPAEPPGDRPSSGQTGNDNDVDEIAARRDSAAEDRDRRAEHRDAVADDRDAQAEFRDRAAVAGEDATSFDRDEGASPPVSDRTKASRDRQESIFDRAAAAGDRAAASADREAAAQDRAAAARDELTGAHRRGAGFVELEREMARARRLGQALVLAFVDVNGLKAINDSRGHIDGDKVLQDVVAALRGALRSYDLIIRFGGDEFLCAIPGVSCDEAAERLSAVNRVLAEAPQNASVTIGLAPLHDDDSLQDLIAWADDALYEQRQRKRVVDLT